MTPFNGSDLTHVLVSKKREDSEFMHLLTSFYLERRHRIVARFPLERILREVTISEVEQCDLTKNTAWVVVGDDVFDVTCESIPRVILYLVLSSPSIIPDIYML